MKKTFLSIALITIASCSFAQWTTSGSNIYYNSGKVGIGTNSLPSSGNLQVNGLVDNISVNASGAFRIYDGTSFAGGVGSDAWASAGNTLDFALYAPNNLNIYGGGQKRISILSSGNVGIGTTAPSTALQIGNFNSGSSNNQLLIPGVYNFEQIKLGQIGNGNSALEFVNHNSTTNSYGVKLLVDVDQVPGLQFQYATSTTSYASLNYLTGLYMNLSGNVGIGTTNPGTYRLAVNGGIHSQSVNVDLTGWADYVFNQGYILPPLAEVKTYIDKNHHLPDVPSEQEVIKGGINLGEMNKLLTKKIEELTLYAIQQQEENEKLKAENKTLKECQQKVDQAQQEQIDELKRQLTKILTKS